MASTVDELDLYEKYLALSDKLRIEEDKTKWVCEALTVLLSLSDADRECYEKVRDAFLRYGNCTISGFNKKFRSSAPLESENFETFVNRVKRYFDRWIGLANVSTFEQLVFLMLKEQIYSSCSDELATYLKDRKPTSLEHMKDLANAFTEARPHVHLSMKKPTLGDTFTSAVGVARSSRPLQKNSDNSRSASNSRTNVQCYRCGKYGHIKKQCRVPEHALKPPATKPCRERSASNVSRSNRNSARESNFQNKQGSSREFSNVAVASAFDAGEDTVTLTQSADAAYFVDGVQFSCVASQPSVAATGKLQFWEAKVNGKCATLLRDSGCTTVGVRKSFVKQEDYTGKRIKCVTFGGTVEEFSTARINLDSEFYSATIVAAVLPNPVADIILGNIEGTVKGDLLTQTACPVTTRAQSQEQTKAQSQEQTKALQNPASVFSLPEGDLGRLQANDESLKGWLGKVGLEQKGPITFIKENGVLFRIYTDRQGSAHKTLAAPNAIRKKLLWAAHDCPLSGHHGVSKTLKNILSEFSWPGVSHDVVLMLNHVKFVKLKPQLTEIKKPHYNLCHLWKSHFNG
ncbi:reverse transcriptase [Plakobranchus ocellatus]|uniref:Reverse transcriptase n=1 Tax=Plakobranchus ocellatus TaxID=259542 RepID=A0AAV3ZMJ9_9GAST|nr:reverse transcriptase [Plakobranchus ocellatus]